VTAITPDRPAQRYSGDVCERVLGRRRLLQASLAVAGLGLLSGCTLPPAPWQPTPRTPRIGYLGIGTAMPNSLLLDAFRQGLRDLGYVEGETIEIEYRFVDGRLEQAPALAHELVELKVDLIVTAGIDATLAAKDATPTIPIIAAILGSDPVAEGLVASLARPGGNVTGLTASPPGISTKQLQILKEVVPSIHRVAVLWNATNPVKIRQVQGLHDSASTLGLTLLSVEIRRQADFDAAFQAVQLSRPDALFVAQEPLMAANNARVAAFAIEQRLPAIYETRLYTDAGGLMNYGVQSVERYYRAATYVDKILKGAKPADLPIEQPTVFDFVINLKAAQAIGLTIPPAVLQQATEILQ
jgi:putative tryptophan/tyrosine transport system substrate-binding protein